MSVTCQETMYSTGEAAKFIGISQSSVINYIDKGYLVPDLIMPSGNGRLGRRKFKESTLIKFRNKLEGKGE